MGVFFFLPLTLIQVHGYSATAAGAASLPFVLIMSVLSRWSGGLVDRFGARPPLILGPLVAAVGLALFALPGTDGPYWTTFFPAMAVLGLGMAIAVPPLTTTVMNAVDVRHVGIASGINNAVSRTAGLLAIALLGLVVLHVFDRELERRMNATTLGADVRAGMRAERIKLGGMEPPATASPAERVAVRAAVAESFVAAFRRMALLGAGLAATSALAAALFVGAPRTTP
jgi:MFS family permease